jgi:shikimate kinase
MTQTPASIVVLIGLRGAGKTTLGKALAAELSRPFEDLDELALATTSASSVTELFAREGEATWRALEAASFEAALGKDDLVLALGGGAPMVESIRTRIEQAREAGRMRVLWIDAKDEVLAARIGDQDSGRPPLLKDDSNQILDPLAECRALRKQRSHTFGALADVLIDSEGAPEDILRQLLQASCPG